MIRTIVALILAWLAIFANAQKQSWLNIDEPDYMEIHNCPERITKVVTDKNATIVYMSCEGDSVSKVYIPRMTYLTDEKGENYFVKRTVGIDLGRGKVIGKKGRISFSLYFPPLPKGTQSFDMIQEGRSVSTRYLNIHQQGVVTRFAATVDTTGISNAIDRLFPDSMFVNDSVRISGKFNGTDLFKQEKCSLVFTVPVPSVSDNQYVYYIDIKSDGSFSGAIPVCGPRWTEFSVQVTDKKYVDRLIPVMLYPKDRLTLVVDDYGSDSPSFKWRSEKTSYSRLWDYSKLFVSRGIPIYKENQRVSLDSLIQTIEVNEQAACYLSNKYNLTKAETALLVAQANMTKVCDALNIIGLQTVDKRMAYRKSIGPHQPTLAQKDTLRSIGNNPLFSVLKYLKADSKAFLVVPNLEWLTRAMLTSPIMSCWLYDVNVSAMAEDELLIFQGEVSQRQIRLFRDKPLGSDRLFEEWFVLATALRNIDANKKQVTTEEVLRRRTATVSLPVYQQWKKNIRTGIGTGK